MHTNKDVFISELNCALPLPMKFTRCSTDGQGVCHTTEPADNW